MSIKRYKRSTNVVYDFGDKSSTQGVIITNPIQSLIKNLYLASTVENASKAISIIGPYGTKDSFNALAMEKLKEFNYKITFTSFRGYNDSKTEVFKIKRNSTSDLRYH